MLNDIKEFLEYRELLFNLVGRELKVKYKRSILGFFWSFLNPLLTMLVFTFVFSLVLRIQPTVNREGLASFPMLLLCALLPWNFFSASVGAGVGSIVMNSNLIRKVYFPKEVLPVSLTLANLVNLFFEMLVLFVFLLALRFDYILYWPWLVLIITLQLMFTIGVSLLFATLNVYFRDVQHFVGIILMVWFYATPIIYPFEYISNSGISYLETLVKINPMTDLILAYRDVLYFGQTPDVGLLAYTAIVAIITFSFSYWLFKRLEINFAEEV